MLSHASDWQLRGIMLRRWNMRDGVRNTMNIGHTYACTASALVVHRSDTLKPLGSNKSGQYEPNRCRTGSLRDAPHQCWHACIFLSGSRTHVVSTLKGSAPPSPTSGFVMFMLSGLGGYECMKKECALTPHVTGNSCRCKT